MSRECVYSYIEVEAYQRYPAALDVVRQPSGLYQISVRSRDTCSAGMIVLSPAQFAAFRLALETAAEPSVAP